MALLRKNGFPFDRVKLSPVALTPPLGALTI